MIDNTTMKEFARPTAMHFRIKIPAPAPGQVQLTKKKQPLTRSRGGVTIWHEIIDNANGGRPGLTTKVEDLRSRFGVAVCFPTDNYNRKTGRRLAQARALDIKQDDFVINMSFAFKQDQLTVMHDAAKITAAGYLDKVLFKALRKAGLQDVCTVAPFELVLVKQYQTPLV